MARGYGGGGGSVNFITEFQKTLEEFGDLSKSDIFKGSVKSVEEMSKMISTSQEKLQDAARKNLLYTATSISGVTKKMEASAQEQMVVMQRNLKALQKAQEEQNQAEITRLEATIRSTQAHYDRINAQQKRDLAEAMKFYKNTEKAYEVEEELHKARLDRAKEIGKVGATAATGLENLASAAESLKDGLSSMDNALTTFKSTTEVFSKGLKFLQAKAAAKAEAGGGIGIFGNISTMLGGLSKAALALGAVVGGAVAVFKVFQALEETVKGFNKELIESVGVNDLMLKGTNNLGESLAKWRKAFSDADYATDMGMTLEEIKKIPASLHTANILAEDFADNLNKMKDFAYGVKSAGISLGMSFESALERTTYFKEELGIVAESGDMLSKLSEEFANIRDMAIQSGYSTQSFYAKIKNLTEGMDNMNNRTEEAGKLLLSFTRVLGAKGANAFLTSMGAGLGGEGYTDLIKRQMLTGRKRILPVLEKEAEYMHAILTKDYKSVLNNETNKKVLAQAGLKDFGESMAEDMKNLQKMTSEQQEDLVSTLLSKKETEGLGREIQKLVAVSKGAAKGASRSEVSTAMGEAGATGSMALKYAQLEAHLGGKSIDAMSDIQKMALEQFSGLSKDQIEQYKVIQRKMRGDLRYAQNLAKTGRELTDEETKRLEKIGLKIDAAGKVVSKDTGTEVKSEVDMILAQREAIESMKEATDEFTQEGLLSEVAENTLTSADMINNYLGEILQTIASYVTGIFNFMDKAKPEDKTRRDAILGELASEIKNLNSQNMEDKKGVRELESKMKRRAAELAKEGKTGEEDAAYMALKAEKDRLEAGIQTRGNRSDVLKRQRSLIRSGEVKMEGTASQIRAKSQATAAAQLAGEGQDIGLSDATKQKVQDFQEMRSMGFNSIDEMINYAMKNDDSTADEIALFLSRKGYELHGTNETKKFTKTGAKIAIKGGAALLKDGKVVHATEGTRLQRLDDEGNPIDFNLAPDVVKQRMEALSESDTSAAAAVDGFAPPTVTMRDPQEIAAEARKQLLAEGELQTAREGISTEELTAALEVPANEQRQQDKNMARETTPLSPEVKKAEVEVQVEAAKKIRDAEKLESRNLLIETLREAGVQHLSADASDEQLRAAAQGKTISGLDALFRGAGLAMGDVPVIDAEDLYISKHGIFKLDPQDLPSALGGGVAFTKPGGAVDQLSKGFTMNVTLNVDGSKSPEETGRAVVKELVRLKRREEGKL